MAAEPARTAPAPAGPVRARDESAPHARSARPPHTGLPATDELLLAMLPGLLALTVCFGWGTLVNLVWALPVALAAQNLDALPRSPPLRPDTLRAALPGVLVLSIALPPATSWWLVAGAAAVAALVRQGTRAGRFPALNPAMCALALALLLFPQDATRWIAPAGPPPLPAQPLGLLDALRAATGLLAPTPLDAFTMATPLDLLRHDSSHTVAELRALHAQFGAFGGRGWDWAGAGFLAGGVYLAWRRLIAWQASAGMLVALLLCAMLYDDGGSSASAGPPLLHLFSGGTLFAAFFVLTDPQGTPRTPRARLAFGALAGTLTFLLRSDGALADGIAFAVLFGNGLAPLLARLDPGPISVPAPARPALIPAIAGVLLGTLVLLAGWRGPFGDPRQAASGTADPLDEVLGPAAQDRREPFPVQDAILLGYGTPRTAWRVRRLGRSTAVVLPVRVPAGYAGPIELLVGIDREGVLTGVRVLEHRETPGIGDAIEATHGDWIGGFRGRRSPLPDAISGATVSSRAVNDAVARALRHFAMHRAMLLDEQSASATAQEPRE